MRNLANDLGFEQYGELSLEVQTDSSAALAICQRRGCGRIRHDKHLLAMRLEIRNDRAQEVPQATVVERAGCAS